jgi:hypothetical protein
MPVKWAKSRNDKWDKGGQMGHDPLGRKRCQEPFLGHRDVLKWNLSLTLSPLNKQRVKS